MAGTSQHTTAYKNKKGVQAKHITSQEYAAMLEQTLLPGGTKLFTQQGIRTMGVDAGQRPIPLVRTG